MKLKERDKTEDGLLWEKNEAEGDDVQASRDADGVMLFAPNGVETPRIWITQEEANNYNELVLFLRNTRCEGENAPEYKEKLGELLRLTYLLGL